MQLGKVAVERPQVAALDRRRRRPRAKDDRAKAVPLRLVQEAAAGRAARRRPWRASARSARADRRRCLEYLASSATLHHGSRRHAAARGVERPLRHAGCHAQAGRRMRGVATIRRCRLRAIPAFDEPAGAADAHAAPGDARSPSGDAVAPPAADRQACRRGRAPPEVAREAGASVGIAGRIAHSRDRRRRRRRRRPRRQAHQPRQALLARARPHQGRPAAVLRRRRPRAAAAPRGSGDGDEALSPRRRRRVLLHEARAVAAPRLDRDLRDRARRRATSSISRWSRTWRRCCGSSTSAAST